MEDAALVVARETKGNHRMKRTHVSVFVGLVGLALAGCQSSQSAQIETAGVAAYAPGAGRVDGGLAGGELGRGLKADDRRTALEAEFRTLEYGRTGMPIVWRGRSGGRGEVVAGPLYQVNDYDCRDYAHTITTRKDETETARATACRRPGGEWRLVS